jgi:hypothetical protein
MMHWPGARQLRGCRPNLQPCSAGSPVTPSWSRASATTSEFGLYPLSRCRRLHLSTGYAHTLLGFQMDRGERRQHLSIIVSGSVDPGHVMLAPAVVAMLQTAKRRHVRVQAAHAASRPVPRTITLLPLVLQNDSSGNAQPRSGMDTRSSGHGDNGFATTAAAVAGKPRHATARRAAAQKQHGPLDPLWLRSLPEAQMAQLLAAWLGAQARAAGSTQGSPVLVQVGNMHTA